MVNVGFGWSSLVGIVLALSGVALYFLRTVRPNLARDYDIALAVVALVCGGILFFNGWRQDPILQFGQLMLTATTIWFAVEALRLRGIATEQAKRSTPIVDDDRPVSKVYRAELDDFAPIDSNRSTVTRRIRGSRDERPDDLDRYEEGRRRPSSRSGGADLDDRPRRSRSSRPLPPERSENRSAWEDDFDTNRDEWGSNSSASRPGVKEDRVSSRPRRRPSDSSRRRDNGTDYVDYQPIDYPGDEPTRPRDY
ncbi:Ycf66 family protein [Phormidium tenue FACHB-886]|nr:Ycf66 family protein [Phormidium tenue FACHB-886]